MPTAAPSVSCAANPPEPHRQGGATSGTSLQRRFLPIARSHWPGRAADLLLIRTQNGHCLIAPRSGWGLLALQQLCDRSMPRLGDALLLNPEQAGAICTYLASLRLPVQPWRPRAAVSSRATPTPPTVRIPPAASPQRQRLSLAQLLASRWFAMPRWRSIALHSILSLSPGGGLVSIPLPQTLNSPPTQPVGQ